MLDRSRLPPHLRRMASVSYYPIDFRCPACAREGSADAAHLADQNGRQSYNLRNLTLGFGLVQEGEGPGTASVRCQCGEKFNA
jgi:hypothetical protein